jgi:hypothetical protein
MHQCPGCSWDLPSLALISTTLRCLHPLPTSCHLIPVGPLLPPPTLPPPAACPPGVPQPPLLLLPGVLRHEGHGGGPPLGLHL